jgi:hypothetical protein
LGGNFRIAAMSIGNFLTFFIKAVSHLLSERFHQGKKYFISMDKMFRPLSIMETLKFWSTHFKNFHREKVNLCFDDHRKPLTFKYGHYPLHFYFFFFQEKIHTKIILSIIFFYILIKIVVVYLSYYKGKLSSTKSCHLYRPSNDV